MPGLCQWHFLGLSSGTENLYTPVLKKADRLGAHAGLLSSSKVVGSHTHLPEQPQWSGPESNP